MRVRHFILQVYTGGETNYMASWRVVQLPPTWSPKQAYSAYRVLFDWKNNMIFEI